MKRIFTLTLLVLSFASQAQNVKLSKHQINANLIPLTVSYEGKVDNNKSFTLSGGIVPSIVVENITSGFETVTEVYFFLHPYLTATFRSYYERNKIKQKDLRNNSGNYIGMFYSHQFTPFGDSNDTFEQRARDRESNVFIIGPVWGIQRNYSNRIHLDFNIGIGYKNGEFINSGDISLVGGLELGFVLFSK